MAKEKKTQAQRDKEFEEIYGYKSKDETKEQKFNRLFPSRVENAVDKINLIGNCASAGYGYDVETVGRVMDYLRAKIDTLESMFTATEEDAGVSTSSEIENAMTGETEEPELNLG